MPKHTFKDVNLSQTSDFGPLTSKIQKWVEYHGGVYSPHLTPSVTHLVCSSNAWKKKTAIVKEALKLKPTSGIQIVTYDWLEDSLQSKSGRPKKVRGEYGWREVEKGRQRKIDKTFKIIKRAQKVKRRLSQFDRDCNQVTEEIGQEGFHLYTDPTSFTYCITLARTDILNNRTSLTHLKVRTSSIPNWSPHSPHQPPTLYYLSPHQNSPILPLPSPSLPFPHHPLVPPVRPLAQQIQLLESDFSPPVYGLYIRYITPTGSMDTDILTPLGSDWPTTFTAFRWFFKQKTGIDWERRDEKLKGPEMKSDGKESWEVDGETGLKRSEWYRYVRADEGLGEGGSGLVVGGTGKEKKVRERKEVQKKKVEGKAKGKGIGKGKARINELAKWFEEPARGGGGDEECLGAQQMREPGW